MKSKNNMDKNYAEKKLSKIDINDAIKQQFEGLIKSVQKELHKINEINAVVLFGSFARGDFSYRHSDIDIMVFIDKTEKDAALEEKILKRIIDLNLGKELNIHTLFQYTKLEEEDKSLMLTIADEGRVVFAKRSIFISDNILGLKSCFLVKFDTANSKPVIKNKLQRFLHGYLTKGKRYKGIVDDENVLNAGKGAIIAPQEMLKKILLFAQSIGVKAYQKAKFYR